MNSIQSPGSLELFSGSVEDYTAALSKFRRFILSPEVADLKILYVPDQTNFEVLQQRGE